MRAEWKSKFKSQTLSQMSRGSTVIEKRKKDQSRRLFRKFLLMIIFMIKKIKILRY